MRKVYKFLVLTMVLCLMISLVACGGEGATVTTSKSDKTEVSNTSGTAKSEEKLELSVSHQYMENSNETGTQEWWSLQNAYIESHPDVKFIVSGINQGDYDIKIQALAAANELPDVFMIKGSMVGNFEKNKLVADLAPYMQKKDGMMDSVIQACLSTFSRGDAIYGIPTQFSSVAMIFYNTAMWNEAGFSEFPDTWDGILEAAKFFNDKGITPISAGNKESWFMECTWLSTLGDRFTGTGWTESIINHDGKAKYTDQEFIDALNFLKSLTDQKLCNPDFNAITNDISQSMYLSETASATIEGFWFINVLNDNPEISAKTKIARLPDLSSGQKGESQTVAGGSGYAIAMNSKLTGAKKDLAFDFCYSVGGPAYSDKMIYETGTPGAFSYDVSKLDVSSFPQLTQDYLSLVNKTTFVPIYDIVMGAATVNTLCSGVQEMLNGSKTPEALAQDIQSEFEKEFSK